MHQIFWLISRAHTEGAVIILKLLFLTWRQIMRKKQITLSDKERPWKSLKFDSGCTVYPIWEGAKIILNLHHLTERIVLIKSKRGLLNKKNYEMFYTWHSVHWLEEHATKFANVWFTILHRLTEAPIKEEIELILELPYLTRRGVLTKNKDAFWTEESFKNVLIKNERGPLNRENLWKNLKLDSGWTGWEGPAPKAAYDQYNELSWLTLGVIMEGIKIILKLLYLTQRRVLIINLERK